MNADSNGDRSGDTRPLWITGLSPPDSWRSLRQPGYLQLDQVRTPKHCVWGYDRTLKVRNFRSTKVGNFQSQLTPLSVPAQTAGGCAISSASISTRPTTPSCSVSTRKPRSRHHHSNGHSTRLVLQRQGTGEQDRSLHPQLQRQSHPLHVDRNRRINTRKSPETLLIYLWDATLVPTDSTKTPSHLIVILAEHPRNFLMCRPEE